MISQRNNNSQTNVEEQDIKLGGFPPILFVGLKNKKIKEFAKLNDKDDNTKNISKLNILDIKNILGVI
jgi:hypothetical protein